MQDPRVRENTRVAQDKGVGNEVATEKGKYLGGVKSTPVRAVEAGPFVMEVWVEEGRDKSDVVAAGWDDGSQ